MTVVANKPVGDDEINDHRGAADQGGVGAAEKIFRGNGAHERQFHVGMRINAAGHGITAVRRNDFGTVMHKPFAERAYHTVFTQHIGRKALLGRDHGATFNQYDHDFTSYNNTCLPGL